jgi:hypothetical protein
MLLALSLLSFQSTWANLEILEVKGLNAQYFSPKGEGKIESFLFGVDTLPRHLDRLKKPSPLPSTPVPQFIHEILVQNDKGDLYFQSAQSYVVWRDAPDFFVNAKKIFSKDLDLLLTYKETKLSAAQLDYDFIDRRFRLVKLDSHCSSSSAGRNIPNRLLENCLSQHSFKVDQILYRVPRNLLQELIATALRMPGFTIDTIEAFEMSLKDKLYHLELRLPQVLNLKLSLDGELNYFKDNKEIKLLVSKVSVGIIPAKRLFLKLLSSINLDMIKVEGDLVTISLGQSK